MAKEVYINIKDLPEITEVSNGEYIIIETPTGTQIIDFKNFVLPVDNTIITSVVSSNSNSITELSSNYNELSDELTTNTSLLSNDTLLKYNTTTNLINSLSEKVTSFNNAYIGQTKITIAASTSTGVNRILPTPSTTLTVDDFIIFPANSYAANNPAYPLNYDSNTGNLTIKSSFKRKYLTFNNANFTSIDPLSTLSQLSATTVGNVLSCLQYAESDGTATETAIYNVLAIKRI